MLRRLLFTCLATVWLLEGNSARAQLPRTQPTIEEIPAIDRDVDDFYSALTNLPAGITVEWKVSERRVPREGEFTLSLIITGALNPDEVTPPNMRNFPTFTEQFQVLSVSGPTKVIAQDRKSVRFDFKLRPRLPTLVVIPPLRWVYYRLDFPEGTRFLTTYTRSIPIEVVEKPVETTGTPFHDVRPVDPFYEVPLRRTGADGLLVALKNVPILLLPILVPLWVVGWRLLNPNAARAARLASNRAARTAVAKLKAAREAYEPSEAAARCLCEYLAYRHGLPSALRTPSEVATALEAIDFPAGQISETLELLRATDEERFSRESPRSRDVIADVERLILRWEGI